MSLAAQRDKIEQFARFYDYELIAVIEDAGASAKTLNRDGLSQSLAMLESGEAGALIVAKLDRLTRSVKDLGELLESHFTRFSLDYQRTARPAARGVMPSARSGRRINQCHKP